MFRQDLARLGLTKPSKFKDIEAVAVRKLPVKLSHLLSDKMLLNHVC